MGRVRPREGPEPAASEFAAPTWSLGAGFEYATKDLAVDGSIEPSFSFSGRPWQLATEGAVQWTLTELVALEAGLRIAPSLGTYELVDTATGSVVATRQDTAVQAAFGVVIYR